MTKALDASALLVYLEKQHGYEKVLEAITHAAQTNHDLLMTTVNWGEVYYILIKHFGLEEAERVLMTIETLPIRLISVDQELAMQAAIYKTTKKLPYADSFAAALARIQKSTLLTSDKEFKILENDIKIDWV